MSHKDTRKGFTQANFNESNSSILYFEILIIAILSGLAFQSWWVFGGVILGLPIMLGFRVLALVLCVLLSLVWGAIGFGIGAVIGGGSMSASIVIGILGILAGLGTHLSALEWTEDIAG